MINGRMNSKVLLFVIAVLVALLGAVYQQYGQSYFGFGCGFEEASELLIRSKRVVTPDSVLSATSEMKICHSEVPKYARLQFM